MWTVSPPIDEQNYIKRKVKDCWTPDAIIGRHEHHISCSIRTLYQMFKRRDFDVHQSPMKEKRYHNG